MAGNVHVALLSAAAAGSITVVKSALEAGADVNADLPIKLGGNRSTALANAAQGGYVDIVKLLLAKGASVVKRVTVYGFSPLHVAALTGHTEVVEVLVHHGATVDTIGGMHRMTPLAYACNYGHVGTVRRLIEFGARVDLVMDYCEEFQIPGTRRSRKKEECLRLMRDALETKQLRCCNPKCNKPGYKSDLKKCAACKLTRYCSRECQRQHWSGGHKTCCGKDEVMWT